MEPRDYNVREVAAKIDALPPKTPFRMKEVLDTGDPNLNKEAGKQLKADIEAGFFPAVPIGKDSANAQWYTKKP